MTTRTPFDTLLVANRGEIACRLITAARALGLATVAVHSDADLGARHVALADRAIRIGPADPAHSYLDIDAVISAALAGGAQAVHPGYGFLAENAEFARACRDAGLVFVGPSPEAMATLGNKAQAKEAALRAGVPCLAGSRPGEALPEAARRIGYPLLVKAAAGGGGRGMRRVDAASDLDAALDAARREAIVAFGADELLLEPYLARARHVEVQILADAHGTVLHLGERDCSTQRRHQKLLEEAPAPGLDHALRERLGTAAVALARECGYTNAGTAEFLVDDDGRFFFLEMNTRLQVEHPVTECVTGIDIVQWQLRIAQGMPLPFAQHEVLVRGHAIEARLCAEDARNAFAPQAGAIAAWRFPPPELARVDHGLAEQARVPAHYDSMIAKLVVHAPTRAEAIMRLRQALVRTQVLGLMHNRDFLLDCLHDTPFTRQTMHTRWLDEHMPAMSAAAKVPADDAAHHAHRMVVAAAATVLGAAARHGPLAGLSLPRPLAHPLVLEAEGHRYPMQVRFMAPDALEIEYAGDRHRIDSPESVGPWGSLRIDGVSCRYGIVHGGPDASQSWLDLDGRLLRFTDVTRRPPGTAEAGGSGAVHATMHGKIAQVLVAEGTRVEPGILLCSLEAMKMQHRVEAGVPGVVRRVLVAAGDQVAPGTLLIEIQPDEGNP